MWKRLKDKIIAMLQSQSASQLQQIYGYEVAEFGGDPCATVTPSAERADYRTTAANRRVYAFNLMLWVKRGAPRSDADSEAVLTDLVDSVTRMFDKYYTLGSGSPGSALVTETGYTMIKVEAVPGEWFYSNREALYRGALITIRCHVDVDVNLIAGT